MSACPLRKQRERNTRTVSGGMRQRAVIAIALACQPVLLIADEPTTALDVTVQAQVLRLMRDIQERFASSILFITHDMGVVGQMADEVVVMYLGQVVEDGPVSAVLSSPAHPYSQGLIASIPTLEMPGTGCSSRSPAWSRRSDRSGRDAGFAHAVRMRWRSAARIRPG